MTDQQREHEIRERGEAGADTGYAGGGPDLVERTERTGPSGSMGPDTPAEDMGPADIATEPSDPEAGGS